MFRTIKDIWGYCYSDAYRYGVSGSVSSVVKLYLTNICYRYSVWLRICSKIRGKIAFKPMYIYSLFRLNGLSYKIGVQIAPTTCIGRGLYIGHGIGIVVNPCAIIGENVNLSQGVTIGLACRGRKKGVPVIGDNVYIAPGAKIIGGIKVGNNVAIGANAVVTNDVPNDATVAGVPARVISVGVGAAGYVVNCIKEIKQ